MIHNLVFYGLQALGEKNWSMETITEAKNVEVVGILVAIMVAVHVLSSSQAFFSSRGEEESAHA